MKVFEVLSRPVPPAMPPASVQTCSLQQVYDDYNRDVRKSLPGGVVISGFCSAEAGADREDTDITVQTNMV